jgi:transketolase
MKNGNVYRRKMLEAAVKGGRGHLGGAFSCIEILMAVHEVMEPNDEFILSKGHAGIALYSILFENIDEFCADGSLLAEHPSNQIPKIRFTTGSLGHGLGLACGIALAKRMNNEPGRTYVLVGDGECMEGSVYEAAMFAGQHRLNDLCMIVDNNGVMSTRNLPSVSYRSVFESLDWTVDPTDGHNLNELRASLKIRYLGTRPHAIIAQTVKGKGVSFMEGKHEWHNGVPKGEQLELARKELSHD